MDAGPELRAALDELRAGRAEAAAHRAQAIWITQADARAAALLALVALDRGDTDAASAWNDAALGRDPANARFALQGARIDAQRGDLGRAYARYASLVETGACAGIPGLAGEFAAIAGRAQRLPAAAATLERALARDPADLASLQAMLDLLAALPVAAPVPAPPVPRAASARPAVSIVTCSRDDGRFAPFARSCAGALGDWPHELVRIADARSLAEGYARGLASASGDIVCFTHDDIELIAPDFAPRLLRRLQDCDVVGIAGATRLTGPAWGHAGHPDLHGCVLYRAATGYRVCAYSRKVPLAPGARTLDGVFLAMRRDTATGVGWDDAHGEGFHGYDIDFCLRAQHAGARLAVASDLGIVHQSYGTYGAGWRAAALELMRVYPELRRAEAAATSFVAHTVPDAAAALALVDRWSRGYAAPRGTEGSS